MLVNMSVFMLSGDTTCANGRRSDQPLCEADVNKKVMIFNSEAPVSKWGGSSWLVMDTCFMQTRLSCCQLCLQSPDLWPLCSGWIKGSGWAALAPCYVKAEVCIGVCGVIHLQMAGCCRWYSAVASLFCSCTTLLCLRWGFAQFISPFKESAIFNCNLLSKYNQNVVLASGCFSIVC